MALFKKLFVNIFMLALLLAFSAESASAYVAYLIGRKTLPGCAFNEGNTCVVKIELPGPPEEGAEIVGEAHINYNTTMQIRSVLFVSQPANPSQFVISLGFTMVSIWHTSDGSPCPIPNP